MAPERWKIMSKNKKRFIWIIGVLLIIALVYAFVIRKDRENVQYNVNLIKNGTFEQLNDSGLPEGWETEAYIPTIGVTEYKTVEASDGYGAQIINHELNDARFLQRVNVAPNTNYRFCADIQAKAEGGKGANISLEGLYVFSESLYDAEEFTRVCMYGRTGANQTQITVFARLGGYSGESVGAAVFDNVALEAVEEVPEDAMLMSWEIPESTDDAPETPGNPAWPWLLAVALLYCVLCVRTVKYVHKNALKQSAQGYKIWLLILTALAARILAAVFISGYSVDINCFTGWANQMAQAGPADFYHSGIYADYPPGYMLILWPIGALGGLLKTGATEFMVKMPPIISDLVIVYIIYKESKKANKGEALSLLYAGIYAFNPVSIIAGAGWGQVDSLLAMLILLTLIFAMQSKWKAALPIYMLAVLTKPQALMAGPLGLAAFIIDIVKNKKDKLKDALLGILYAFITAAVVILPFQVNERGLSWLIDLYAGTMTYYTGATVNATNIYFLFGLNWLPVDGLAPLSLRLTAPLCIIVPVIAFALKQKETIKQNSKFWLAAFALAVLPLIVVMAAPVNLSIMGYLFIASSFILTAAMYIRKKDINWLTFFGAVMLILFSSLGTMMHERYMFPALVLLIYFYAEFNDKRVLALILLLSTVMFMNVGIVLDRAYRIGGAAGHLDAPTFNIVSDSSFAEYLNAVIATFMAGLSVYWCLALSGEDTLAEPVKTMAKEQSEPKDYIKSYIKKESKEIKLDKRDWIIMASVCLVYSVIAFADLGSKEAPENAFVFSESGQEAVFDLGESKSFNVIYYPGIHWDPNNTFTISSGESPENMQSFAAKAMPGDCFNWQTHTQASDITANPAKFSAIPIQHEGRYLKITSDNMGLYLYEIMALDANTGEKLPLKLASENGEELIDEQSVIDGHPTWRNGMYFDEIYHARTGLEQLNALRGEEPSSIYEVSHPPLGKVFMTLSIAIFGMTPFAWRLPGAIAGVIMLPGMYMLGKLFTKKRYLAAMPMLLMALDCMHFAQTRIATIDSFVTLFIIWSTYFMFRYAYTNVYEKPFSTTAKYLFLSGLFMGLACASKWSGCYAGLGLAVIFFISLFRQVRAGKQAEQEKRLVKKDALTAKAASTWKKTTVKTLLLCVVFFVIIPFAIYCLSFYPVFAASPGGLTISKVLRENANMFNYHSSPGLGAEHPFASKWYMWPLSQKPIYYYAGSRVNGTGSAIWSFGNPVVWWLSTAALIIIIASWIIKRCGKNNSLQSDNDSRGVFIVIAYLAQYLPWVFVPRGTYIYHYFTALPFAIMALAFVLDKIDEKNVKLGRRLSLGIAVLATLMFIGFYPYISGERVSTAWLDLMRWFPNIWY